jgi:hypothetical protein
MSLGNARSGFYTTDGEWADEDLLFRLYPAGPFAGDVGPLGREEIAALTFAPGLGLLYGVDDTLAVDELVTVDLDTGQVIPRGPLGFAGVRALAWDPLLKKLYGVDTATDVLLRIHPWTGAATSLGPLGFGGVEALAFDPDSRTLYGADVDTDQLLVIDTGSGSATPIGPFGGSFDRIEGLAWDTLEGRLYGIEREPGSGDGRAVVIDTATGAASQVGPTFGAVGANSLAFVPGLPVAYEGRPYDGMIPVAGGCPPYLFSDFVGLPESLVADETGRLTGVPYGIGVHRVDFWLVDHDLLTPPVQDALFLLVNPGNDLCENAFQANDGGNYVVTLRAATDGPDEPGICAWEGHTNVKSDVWFCYTATCSGLLSASACETSFDNKIAVYDGCGCPDGPSAIACNDDACGFGAGVEVPVVAGRQYGVRVGSRDDSKGETTLWLQCHGAPGGGCCTPGDCSFAAEEECLARGGRYLGDGVPCEPDSDGDGVADECDGCADDPQKPEPGVCGCGRPDIDSDADSLPDCTDPDDDDDGVEDEDDVSPMDRYRCQDSDRDGCDDCSSGWWDPAGDGLDADGDGYCAVGDCDDGYHVTFPGAPEVNDGVDNNCPDDPGYGLVDEIDGLLGFYNSLNRDELSWLPQPGAADYQIVRSLDRQFHDCLTVYWADPVWVDPELPGPEEIYFYLVRPWSPHVGSWGRNGDGVERSVPCALP